MSKTTLKNHVRLTDGTVCTINEGLNSGTLVRAPFFVLQHDENGGNIIGLPTKWKDCGGYEDLDKARKYIQSARHARILKQIEVHCANDSHKTYGHLSRTVLK